MAPLRAVRQFDAPRISQVSLYSFSVCRASQVGQAIEAHLLPRDLGASLAMFPIGCTDGCVNSALKKGTSIMIHYALTFLIIALIAAFLGFGGIAGMAASIAKILFFVFIVLAVVSVLVNLSRGRGNRTTLL